MRFIIDFWAFWLLPAKFFGGGGETRTEPQTNPEEQALARISEEKWAEYKKRYIPLENQWIEQVSQLNDHVYHNQAAGLTSNEVKNKYGPQTQEISKGLVDARGPSVRPYVDQAKDISSSVVAADMGVTDRYLKGIEGVIAMGQGQSSQAIQGLSDVADSSVRAQIDRSRNTFAAKQSNDAIYGTVAGGLTAASANSNTIKKISER